MTQPFRYQLHHYCIPGTERPICAAQTGHTTSVVGSITCTRCRDIVAGMWRWRLVGSPADSVPWIEDVENVAVCRVQGTLIEVRTRTPDTIKLVRKRLQAEAYPIVKDNTVTVTYRKQASWPCSMLALRGGAAKAAISLCSLNVKQPEAA